MAPKFLKKLFAEEGEIEEIPDPSQPSGVVSMTTGYGYDYERDPSSDPMAKDIERKKMNWLFRTITEGLQRFQTVGTHPFIAPAENGGTAYAYIKGARCMYASALYESLVDNNTTLPTDKTKWRDISAGAQNWAPIIHNHPMDDVNGLISALNGKAVVNHSHPVDDINGLSNVLASYVQKTLKIFASGPVRVNTATSSDLAKDVTISINDASETAAGITRFNTDIEASTGTSNSVAVTPRTKSLAPYRGLVAGTTDLNTFAVGTGIEIEAVDRILVLDASGIIPIGATYLFNFIKGATLQLPAGVTLAQRGGGRGLTIAAGGSWVAPENGGGWLRKHSATSWYVSFYVQTPLASDNDAATGSNPAALTTMRTRAIQRLVGLANGVPADISTYTLGTGFELSGAGRSLLLTTTGIPNGTEYRVYAMPGAVLRLPDGMALYGRGNIGWSNTLIVGGGDWVAQYKFEGVLRKFSDTVWLLIANYQYEQATASSEGVTAFATTAETIAGTLATKAVTPAGVKAFAAPLPKTTTGPGQFIVYEPDSAPIVNLPAGGTWLYCRAVFWNGSGRDYVSQLLSAPIYFGIAAGGTTLPGRADARFEGGFALRIS